MNKLQLIVNRDENEMPFTLDIYEVPNIEDIHLIGGDIPEENDFNIYLDDEDSSKADKWDYSMAAANGLLTSLFNNYFVGEFSFKDSQNWGAAKISRFVIHVASSFGYDGNTLEGAIASLERI